MKLPVCWNVYKEEWNHKAIEVFNIFNHGRFMEDCAKDLKKFGEDIEGAKERIRSNLLYYFWSKCEYEVIIKAWVDPRDTIPAIKIDIFEQVMNNWDIFFDYVWNHRKEIISFVRAEKRKSKK